MDIKSKDKSEASDYIADHLTSRWSSYKQTCLW